MRREHVHFIDDEDFVAITRGSDVDAGDDHIAHVIDLRMRSRIDFQHIHRSTFGDLTAG